MSISLVKMPDGAHINPDVVKCVYVEHNKNAVAVDVGGECDYLIDWEESKKSLMRDRLSLQELCDEVARLVTNARGVAK